MITRWRELFCATILVICITACGHNHDSSKVYQVGIVSLNPHCKEIVEGFLEGMEKFGYFEGDNVKYIHPGPLDNLEQAESMIHELISKKVDLIYTITTPATKAAKRLTSGTTIPVIFGPMMSPVESGLVSSVFSPENTITGVMVRGSTEKTLQYLLEILPDLKNIFVPFHVGSSPAKICIIDLKKATDKFDGLTIIVKDVNDSEELLASLEEIPDATGAIWLTHSNMITGKAEEIVEFSNKRKIPVTSPMSLAKDGVLISYSSDFYKIGEQISRLANKALKGVAPSSLPIETAEFFLEINVKTARIIGVEVPSHVLNQAEHIFR